MEHHSGAGRGRARRVWRRAGASGRESAASAYPPARKPVLVARVAGLCAVWVCVSCRTT